MKTKATFIPREVNSNVRQAIFTLLKQHTLSAREIFAGARIPGKEIFYHLTAIHKNERVLVMTPAVCRKYIWERLPWLDRCPVCRNERKAEPDYGIP